MREKNRNSIASCNKLPQFTIMNAIDGQAGLVFYTSLFFYSLTIDNILNIIVLMILSGIVVATSMGNIGLITSANEAKENNRAGAVQDEVALALSENKITDEINKTKGTTGGLKTKADVVADLVEKGYLKEEESNKLLGENGEEEQDTITIGSITIDFSKLAGGNGEEDTAAGTLSIELSIAGTKVNATTPPKPNNFYYVGGTIDSGYVISDNASDENKYASSETVGTDLQGNQFVWVPVEANQKITLKVTSPEDITSIKLYDPVGEEISLGAVSGKSYNNTNIEPTINGLYKAEVATASGTESKNLVVRSLYAKDAYSDYYATEEGIAKFVEETHLSTKEDLVQKLKEWNLVLSDNPTNEEIGWVYGSRLKQYSDSVDYTDSVNANGGFYIARYEAGATTVRTSGNSNDTVDTIKSANGVPTSKADQIPYNWINQSQAMGLAESMYQGSSFTCTLPTGAAWDRTLGWLINTGNKNLSDVENNSSDWGNYRNVSFDITRGKYSTNEGDSYTAVSGSYTKPDSGVLLTTGAAPTRNVSNNVFDLAGNVCEWTTESNGSYVVARGGRHHITGYITPSSNRYENYTVYDYSDIGFRPALFVL